MKTRSIISIVCLILIIVIAIVLMMKNNVYSVTDVFKNADFNTENPSLNIESIDINTEDIFSPIEVSPEKQRELINALENAGFIKTEYSSEFDYRINLTLNTGYNFYVDSDKEIIVPVDEAKAFTIKNNNNFFAILKDVTR